MSYKVQLQMENGVVCNTAVSALSYLSLYLPHVDEVLAELSPEDEFSVEDR